jgi:hypothetical protein
VARGVPAGAAIVVVVEAVAWVAVGAAAAMAATAAAAEATAAAVEPTVVWAVRAVDAAAAVEGRTVRGAGRS